MSNTTLIIVIVVLVWLPPATGAWTYIREACARIRLRPGEERDSHVT